MIFVYGFALEWAVFFLTAVPLIVLDKPFIILYKAWMAESVVLVLAGMAVFMLSKEKRVSNYMLLTKSEVIYLGLFLAIVLFQFYKTVFYSYEDGDDAFYVSMANVIDENSSMYRTEPYLGVASLINYRYAIAPFPMWLAVIAKFVGINGAIIAHTVIPVFLILVTYAIFNEIAILLFEDNREKRFMFLTLAAAYEMFSAVSTSTSGRFLLTRARQGKEALANIILPLLFYEIFRIIKNSCEIRFNDLLRLAVVCAASALTSTFGNVLAPIMVMALCLYLLIVNKSLKKAVAAAFAVIPNLLTVLLYMKLN